MIYGLFFGILSFRFADGTRNNTSTKNAFIAFATISLFVIRISDLILPV